MHKQYSMHTIAAIATAYGESGIGIVRISGEQALPILVKIFRTSNGVSLRKADFKPRCMRYGKIIDPSSGATLDEVMCVYMKGPHSYTAEDVVEIQCHGSIVSLRNILSTILSQGATAAEPGEFTLRAFLNGRIDIAQAEAIIDLIQARSDKSFQAALDQAEGLLSRQIDQMRDLLFDALVFIGANLDYPEEDIEDITYTHLQERLAGIRDQLLKYLEFAEEGRIIREGFSIVIAGKPNVGKSSLLNFFVRENRAIVTDIPGTTRDTIQERVSLAGIPIQLTDTAGIRRSDNVVEQLGIERSKNALDQADMILFLVDASEPLSNEDEELCHMVDEKRCIVLLNKADLPVETSEQDVRRLLPDAEILSTSLTEGIGLKELEQKIVESITGGKVRKKSDVLLTNIRHINCVEQALSCVQESIELAKREDAMDFMESYVREAYDSLGEITGQTAGEDVIEEIFSRFCLGK